MALYLYFLYVLVALYNSARDVFLVVIDNPVYVIVFFSSPAYDEGAGAVVVVSATGDGSVAVFSIIVIG